MITYKGENKGKVLLNFLQTHNKNNVSESENFVNVSNTLNNSELKHDIFSEKGIMKGKKILDILSKKSNDNTNTVILIKNTTLNTQIIKLNVLCENGNYILKSFIPVIASNGKSYLRPHNDNIEYFDSVRPGISMCRHVQLGNFSHISDHLWLYGHHQQFKNITIATFNACMSRLVLRGLQGYHNHYHENDEYIGMVTGDALEEDQERRNFIVNYIIEKLLNITLVLLQEIDYLTYLQLKNKGINIIYSEEIPLDKRTTEYNSNRGGVAIASSSSLVEPMENMLYEDIFDCYLNRSNKKKQKHIGIKVNINIDQINFSVISLHCSGFTEENVISKIFNDECQKQRFVIFGGDFNRNVFCYNINPNYKITPNDRFRYATIDAVFCNYEEQTI